MTVYTALFIVQAGNYSVITADDVLVFYDICQALSDHASVSRKWFQSIFDYVQSCIQVNLSEENLDVAAIAILKTVGAISTSDNVHIGLTPLGYGFYRFIQV